ncbi:hypothetical protein K432DRAFT_397153 [Lepidopterella palustris CBS 459.81]|uniref:Uncharacterized protein n=1 Tax=Lepidopterella palustris CBS 459.81 TaxID=1314670 RepID=A0A8E2JAL6_9PEZI|nr:hypothetical protein K432DRAFT_397153 [Lepidopterella palustris CBS 459.81]
MSASFLGLPVELRLGIYKLLFNQYDGVYKPHILLVCHQIRVEAMPLYLEWTTYFSSFDKLIKWTSAGNLDLLALVKDISIQILDDSWSDLRAATHEAARFQIVDELEQYSGPWWTAQFVQHEDTLPPPEEPEIPTPSIRSRLSPQGIRSLITGRKKPPAIEPPTIGIISQIWASLQSMPNVQSCWINLNHKDAKMQPLHALLLSMVSVAFPKLRSFSFFSHLISLDFLAHFRSLRLLRFTGYSLSTPEDLLVVLRSLESLDSISLYRYPEYYDRDYANSSPQVLDAHLSLTPDVITNMRPLKSLEISHMSSSLSSAYLTIPMLRAWRSHHRSLRSLRIGTDERLSKDVVTELLGFIAQTEITRLQLRSQGDLKPIDISKHVPRTVRFCEVALKCDGFGASGGAARHFHNHSFTEIDLQDPQYRDVMDDSFARQLLH